VGIEVTEQDTEEILRILNDPGMTWKVRRALLRAKGLPEKQIEILIPEPPQGMDWHPSDY
jgi:hypothetical protein